MYDDAMMPGPPAVVTTLGDWKRAEPDWCTPPPNNRNFASPRADTRGEYNWAAAARGGNSLVADERDTRVPVNAYNYPPAMGRAPSPRQYQGQQLSSREVASYKAAIQAVNDSMGSEGRSGSITALRGLWKVFDAAVSELGTELNDSLSNKAIFEANVMQETMMRQGRRISDFEKKSDALCRKSQYEVALRSTLLRLRGSFADVILGTKKEIQSSIDKSFESLIKDRLAEQEKAFTKKQIATEQTFAMQLTERDRMYAARTAEAVAEKDKVIAELNAKLLEQRDDANKELARLTETIHVSQARMNEAEQTVAVVQAQLGQERQGYAQAIAAAEKGREDAVAKLSSTLETLQATCNSLTDAEIKLRQTEERLELSEHERRQEIEHFDRQWKVESERAGLLQQKLDKETKNKHSLVSVQKEMEKHLELERERADLLQQQLAREQEVVQSLKEADRQRREEMREELNRANEDAASLQKDLNACQDRLDKTSEMNALLESKVGRLEAQVVDQDMDLEAARMSEADVEKSLAESLARADDLEGRLRHTMHEMQTVAEQLADECRGRQENAAALKEREEELAAARAERDDLETVRDALRDQLAKMETDHGKLRKVSVGLERENDALKDRLGRVEKDYGTDREKIATALAGFDEEMCHAEEKLRKVLVELEAERKKVQVLTDSQERAVKTDAKLRQQIENEKRMLKESFEAELTKANKDLGVYEEAIKMLQKQVDLLQDMVDRDCEKCAKRDVELEEGANEAHVTNGEYQKLKQELMAKLNTQKLEQEGAMKVKEAEMEALRESSKRREESMEKLEELCAKARTDLADLRNQKTFLEGSLEKAIKYINSHKAQPRDDETTKRSSVGFQDDFNFDAVDQIIMTSCDNFKDLGGELDSLLASIEKQLFVAPK